MAGVDGAGVWSGLGAAVWVQVASGNSYAFPLFSHSLKSILGFTQQQVTLLGVANDFGENFGILQGHLNRHFAPWLMLAAAALSSLIGFGLLWLYLVQFLDSPPLWMMSLALFIATNSSPWMSTCVLSINMGNFPNDRGNVTGVLKAYVGLSAGVFTLIYKWVLHSSSRILLRFLAIAVPAICVVSMIFIHPYQPSPVDDRTRHQERFLCIQISSFVLGVFLVLTTAVNDSFSSADLLSYVVVCVSILFLLIPLVIPLTMLLCRAVQQGSIRGPSSSSEIVPREDGDNASDALIPRNSPEIENAESDAIEVEEGEQREPKIGETFKFRQAVKTIEFWLLSLSYFCAVGSGVTVLNNLAQIGIALNIDNTTFLLSVFGFFNFIGRLVGGFVSERFLRYNTPRSTWMVLAQAIMAIAHLLFAFASKLLLYISTGTLGFCYGVQLTVTVSTVSDLFGLENWGTIYNAILLGNPLGAAIFSSFLAGRVYDSEAAKQHTSTCTGHECFRLTFLVLAAVCVVGSVLCLYLTSRVKSANRNIPPTITS